MTNYSDGRRFEYKVRDALAADGYEIIRAAGSKGKVDLVAFKAYANWDGLTIVHLDIKHEGPYHELLFVQCKRRDGNIGTDDRPELLRLARIANAIPLVAHQPVPRKPIRYRRLIGPGPKDWQPWTPDEVAP